MAQLKILCSIFLDQIALCKISIKCQSATSLHICEEYVAYLVESGNQNKSKKFKVMALVTEPLYALSLPLLSHMTA
jgi:hypothetical protein